MSRIKIARLFLHYITVIYITMYKYIHITEYIIQEQNPIFVVLKVSLDSCGPYTSCEESPQTSHVGSVPGWKSLFYCQSLLRCLYTADALCDGWRCGQLTVTQCSWKRYHTHIIIIIIIPSITVEWWGGVGQHIKQAVVLSMCMSE